MDDKSGISPFTGILKDKLNLFEFSGDYKLKRKVCELLKTNGKMMLNLSSVLSVNNFFKYDYKNIRDALSDILKEKDIFEFIPSFSLSKEYEDEIFYKNRIEFDLYISFKESCIKKESAGVLETMSGSINAIRENNKNIISYYLYRLMKEEKCYFYPVELIARKLLTSTYDEFTLEELYSMLFEIKNVRQSEGILVEALKNELNLVKENKSLNFTRVCGEESAYFNQKEIDGLIEFNLKAKEVNVVFLRQNLKFNARQNSLMEEIIYYFNEFLLGHVHISQMIRKNLPPDKKHFIDNMDIFNFDEIIQTLIDPKLQPVYHLPENFRKEFVIISRYISENQKFFLDNIELNGPEENFSKDLKEEIREELKLFLNTVIAELILNKKGIDFVFTYSEFLVLLYKSVKKDKNIVLKIFNNDLRNKHCFFMYLRYDGDSEEIEFFNNPVEQSVVIIPLGILKEIAVGLIKSEFRAYDTSAGGSKTQRDNVLIYINVLKLIMKKPQTIGINIDSDESVKSTGFYGKNDIKEMTALLESKYENIKNILNEDEIISLKNKETLILKKHRILNSIRLVVLFVQKIMLRDKYYKNLKNLNMRFEEKLIDKEIRDQKAKKKIIRQNNEFKTAEFENESKRIEAVIENMDDDEKKLFSNIYNCIKNKGLVEYVYRDNKLNVEILLKTSSPDDSPQMYISLSEPLHELVKQNIIMLERKNIRLTERIRKYFGLTQ